MPEHTVKIQNGQINFSCKMNYCVHSCCGPFSGVAANISSLDKRPFNEIVLTQADYQRLYKHGYADLVERGFSPETGKHYYKMALESNGSCKAFADGHCCINSFKPTLCKAFPFYFDMFSGLCAINCEGFTDDYWTDLSALSGCFEAAREMYAFWIDFYGAKGEK